MTRYERFESVAEAFIEATDEQQQAVLSLLSKSERETFLKAVGLYHLLTDEVFYKTVCREIGKTVYSELRKD